MSTRKSCVFFFLFFFKLFFLLLFVCGCGCVAADPIKYYFIIFARRLRPNFNSSKPDWLHPLNYPRLACLSPPLLSTFFFPLCFFPLHDFISLLYFFIHETEKSLSLIICLISSHPSHAPFLNTQQVNLHPGSWPLHFLPHSFGKSIRVGKSLKLYPVVFTTTKRFWNVLSCYCISPPDRTFNCVSIVFVVLPIGILWLRPFFSYSERTYEVKDAPCRI